MGPPSYKGSIDRNIIIWHMAVLSVSCTISLDLPLKNTCPRYILIMLSTQHHLCKRLNKVGMEDLLELTKKVL